MSVLELTEWLQAHDIPNAQAFQQETINGRDIMIMTAEELMEEPFLLKSFKVRSLMSLLENQRA